MGLEIGTWVAIGLVGGGGFALHALGFIPGTPPFLRKVLHGGDRQERLKALQTLVNSRSHRSVPLLKEAYDDPDEAVRALALRGLLRCNHPTALPALRKASMDRDPRIRRQVAEGLGDFTDEAAMQMLSELVTDLDPSVAAQATTSLGKRKDQRSVVLLASALGENDEIASRASKALMSIGSSCFNTLCEQIPHMSPSACERLAPLLVQIDSSQALRPLGEILKTVQNRGVLEAALKALAGLADPAARTVLLEHAEDGTRGCRPEALAYLAGHDDPGMAAKLATFCDDRDPQVRLAATDALVSVRNPARLDTLLSALDSPDSRVVTTALRGLGHYDDVRILKSLVLRLWPEEADTLAPAIARACHRPLESIGSIEELLPVLGRLSGRDARGSEDQRIRPHLQSLYIVLRPSRIAALKEGNDALLHFLDSDFQSEVHIDRLHSFARQVLTVHESQRGLDRWRNPLAAR
jgi:HEAT repeat protein